MLLILQSRMARENRREHLELKASHKHLVDLCIARESVAHKAFVVLWVRCIVSGHVEGFVKELEIRYVVANVGQVGIVLGQSPPGDEKDMIIELTMFITSSLP